MPLIDNLFLASCDTVPVEDIIASGSVSTFSMVILVEGLSNLFNVQAKGGSKLTKGLKSVTYGFAIVIFTLNVYLYGKTLDLESIGLGKKQLLAYAIMVFTFISILVSTYLFCFRETQWEIEADEYVKKQNSELGLAEAEAETEENPIPSS